MNPTNAPAAILNESSLAAEPARSIWRDAVRRLLRGRVSRICLIVVALYALMGLVSFTSLLDWRIEHHFTESFSPPALSIDLLLGTDIQGRSVFWRLLYGSRVALTITVLASLISLGIGTVLGMIAGFFGGWLDELITWLYTTASAVPETTPSCPRHETVRAKVQPDTATPIPP